MAWRGNKIATEAPNVIPRQIPLRKIRTWKMISLMLTPTKAEWKTKGKIPQATFDKNGLDPAILGFLPGPRAHTTSPSPLPGGSHDASNPSGQHPLPSASREGGFIWKGPPPVGKERVQERRDEKRPSNPPSIMGGGHDNGPRNGKGSRGHGGGEDAGGHDGGEGGGGDGDDQGDGDGDGGVQDVQDGGGGGGNRGESEGGDIKMGDADPEALATRQDFVALSNVMMQGFQALLVSGNQVNEALQRLVDHTERGPIQQPPTSQSEGGSTRRRSRTRNRRPPAANKLVDVVRQEMRELLSKNGSADFGLPISSFELVSFKMQQADC
ncbi:hypothetical protein OF83DRAFT_1087435 [Amylostereum chailletii]|nr:hypothetical protein OF83DRAFT_1087435 [Amylostereum chailletii]